MSNAVVSFESVSVVRDGRTVLDDINWEVTSDQRWAVLGPNGAGKTTLLELASAQLPATTGTVTLLDEPVADTELELLRPHLGIASSAISRRIPLGEKVLDAVMTAAYAITSRWKEDYEPIDERRALRVLAEWKVDQLAERRFGELSDGEQKRVQIARSVMADPELLLLDEPAASLDLGAREELLALLGGYAKASSSPAIVIVTHHVEEIPEGFTHALLMTGGRVVAQGPVRQVVTSELLSQLFGLPLTVALQDGRYSARSHS